MICEGYSVEEIHVDDEGDAFRVKYEMLTGVNRIMVIDDDEYDRNNDGIDNKVMEARALCREQEKWVTRARQLDRKEEDIAAAQQNIRKNRLKNKAYFDKNCRERVDKIGVGDMVLLYNSSLDKQWSQKLKNRWLGPYRIREIAEDRGTYLLDELDGTQLDGIFAGDRIKKFHPRHGVDAENGEDADAAKDDGDDGDDSDEEDVYDAAVEKIDDAEDADDARAEDDVEDDD